ncbi:MAG: cell division protein ZapA [Pseudomonadota bacterium]|jgi:cell division protein ZapA
MKQLDVEIMGQRYLLSWPENGEAALLKAVERVDMAMCKIRDAGKVKARDRIAVLASLNLAFELSEALEKAQAVAAAPAPTLPVPTEDVDVEQLLQRLDQVLMDDSRLL